MTYTGWIDDEPEDSRTRRFDRARLRLAGAGLVGLAGLIAAAMVASWAFAGIGHAPVAVAALSTSAGPSSPAAFDEEAMARRAAQLAADAASEAESAADPVASATFAALPSWLFDPTPLAGPTRPRAVAPAPSGPVAAVPEPEQRVEIVRSVPLPMANPLGAARLQALEGDVPLALQRDQLAAVPLPPRNPLLGGEPRLDGEPRLASLPPPAEMHVPTAPAEPVPERKSILPGPGDRFAVYDIKNSLVYMPSGEKLEAHSGYGEGFDNLAYVSVRMRGPTPPNVYTLKMRERLFHGVEALRMTPVGEGKMHGRDGFLTHSYLMGPRGDSNGCVSFKDYDKFLEAYKRGEVTRLVVVEDAGVTPSQSNPLLAWLANMSRER
ncbi:DUF2778 domain-containing protein [Aquabacter spiritensis]|uniref:Uncharacterized protein DUF2778 n=1 Tax=Aquabacter spiritensis TaxID=933073 RepID=A0A4R3LZR1_9HYPH|nr:DUF2778 domain-containing protein [Aquabacter spiritensis]TCT06210.1 uncharacterized protein DUF2778 [Aquabacter spiritensis]